MDLRSKYRITGQRKLVYSLVHEAKDHPNAMSVYERARAVDPKISMGTVYRTLNLLHEEGLLTTLSVGGAKRFDGDVADHWHFLCRICGDIYDLRMPELQGILNELMKNMYRVEELRLEMKGVCHRCAAKEPVATSSTS